MFTDTLRLHHIGIVVPEIESAQSAYLQLGYQIATPIIHDETQTAYVQFLKLGNADHYVELVAPDGTDSKLSRASKAKQPLNHLCYSCGDIVSQCDLLSENGWMLISAPTPAVAFGGRKISWLMHKSWLLMELVEAGKGDEL